MGWVAPPTVPHGTRRHSTFASRRLPMEDFNSIALPPHANPIVIQWLKEGKLKIMPSGCWEWTRARNKGYPQAVINSKPCAPHRLAINAEKGLVAMHSCDNPPCCNPWHLHHGTMRDNKIDMKIKGRGRTIGILPRCSCGKAITKGHDCLTCKAIRLDKPFCGCGIDRIRAKGLCSCCYQRACIARRNKS